MTDNYLETENAIQITIERLNALKNNNSKYKPQQQNYQETKESQQLQKHSNFQAISVKTSFYGQSKNFDSNAYNYNETQNPQNDYQTINCNTIQTNQQQIELKLDNLKESIHFNIQESYDLNSYIQQQQQLFDSTEIQEHLDEQLQKPKESEIQNTIKSKIQNQSIQRTEEKNSQNQNKYIEAQSLLSSNSKLNVNDNFNTLTYKQQSEINQFF